MALPGFAEMSVCQSCGACCAAFRVDFHPAELAGGNFAWDGGVPVDMTVRLTPNMVRMCGTDSAAPRCVALAGEIGQQVNCTIYHGRPSPCREFDVEHAACNRARQRHGLAPL
ncbi:YkgJ family cysteine cluster protein [Dechloromonas sp. TW-R-39-2]|nr:YkgJ family cysteine cluster protein [Dechloromonas sp. TW-R-39-2]